MAFDEDLSAFFDTSQGFADAVTVGGQALKAIFQNEYVESNGIAGVQPVALLEQATLPAITPSTTTLVHSGTTYLITQVEQDGTGLVRLWLRESS